MKKLFVAACLLVASSMAFAGEVCWKINWGVYTHDATDLVTEESGAVLDQYDILWQLISAGDNNAIDPVDITNSAKGFVSGDDAVVVDMQGVEGTRLLSKGNSGIWDNFLYTDNDPECQITLDGATYSGTYVFQRIFEAQTPVEGTYYYESELVQLGSDFDAAGQMFALGPDTSGIQANNQIPTTPAPVPGVPEPATMSLLGLGALAMVLRRKLSK